MNLIDKVILEWSYKTKKGYPDINSQEDMTLFESIFGFNLINEAKHPFEYLSKEAQEVGKDLIQKLNLVISYPLWATIKCKIKHREYCQLE